MRETTWKRYLVRAVVAGIALLACAYGFAWWATTSCEDLVYEDIAARHVQGRGLLGERIPVQRDNVEANVAGPLQVEVSYFVPIDMHGVLYSKRYLVLPGKRILLHAEKLNTM